AKPCTARTHLAGTRLHPRHDGRLEPGSLSLRGDDHLAGRGAAERHVELAVRWWYGEAAGPQRKRIVPGNLDCQWCQRLGVHRLLSASQVAGEQGDLR